MKKLELVQMEGLQGGDGWDIALGGACALGLIGAAFLGGPAGIALSASLGIHSCALALLRNCGPSGCR